MKKIFALNVLFGAMILFIAPVPVFGQLPPVQIMHFPQIAYGGGYTTIIKVANVTDKVTEVTFNFRNASGWLVGVPVNQRIISEGPTFNPGDLQPKSLSIFTLHSESPDITVGSLHVSVHLDGDKPSAQVFVQYSYAPNGSVIGQATVEPTIGFNSKNFGFQAVQSSGSNRDSVDTGIAIANLGENPAHIVCNIRNMAGQGILSVSRSVAWHDAFFITELAPELKSNWPGGLVECVSDQPVASMTLFYTVSQDGSVSFSTGGTFPLSSQ